MAKKRFTPKQTINKLLMLAFYMLEEHNCQWWQCNG